jgi:hypothetical protein
MGMLEKMNLPKSCVLWRDPESAVSGPSQEGFERLETFLDESHWWRYLLKCRECGQLYVFEFKEEVDWVDGDDPQSCTWIPVETDEEVHRAKTTAPRNLRTIKPHLCDDRPKGGERKVYWVAAGG